MARLDVAVIDRDGTAVIVNATRPATLVAFTDEFDGKVMPETMREVTWVVHNALGIDEPLDDWLKTLETVSANAEDVALARRIIAGDESAKAEALGLAEPSPAIGEDDAADPSSPPDPALEQLDGTERLARISGAR